MPGIRVSWHWKQAAYPPLANDHSVTSNACCLFYTELARLQLPTLYMEIWLRIINMLAMLIFGMEIMSIMCILSKYENTDVMRFILKCYRFICYVIYIILVIMVSFVSPFVCILYIIITIFERCKCTSIRCVYLLYTLFDSRLNNLLYNYTAKYKYA